MLARKLFSKNLASSFIEKPALIGIQKYNFNFFSKPSQTLPDPYGHPSAYYNPKLPAYLKKVFKWSTIGTTIGISSALVGSFAPMGPALAFIVLGGAAMDAFATNYLERTRPKIIRAKGNDGLYHYETKNPILRRLAYLACTMGVACFAVPALSFIGIASTLPIAAALSIFSSIGHLGYSALLGKSHYNPWHSAMIGAATGLVGLHLLGLCTPAVLSSLSIIADGEMDALYLKGFNMGSYVAIGLYNMFTAYDTQKVAEDIKSGKDDYLIHAPKFSENWMLTLVPYVLFS